MRRATHLSGITNPWIQGTNRPNIKCTPGPAALYTEDEGNSSLWKSSDPVTYILKYRNPPESRDRMTTMNSPGLQVFK